MDAREFDAWDRVSLLLTNPYAPIVIERALKADVPCICHVISAHDFYRENAFVDYGPLFEGKGPPDQRLFVKGLPEIPLDVGGFSVTEDGFWPEAFPLLVLSEWARSHDTVFDPFMGRGTTGKACQQLGLNFIGIDKREGRVEMARRYLDVS